jgi:hypothetical protein
LAAKHQHQQRNEQDVPSDVVETKILPNNNGSQRDEGRGQLATHLSEDLPRIRVKAEQLSVSDEMPSRDYEHDANHCKPYQAISEAPDEPMRVTHGLARKLRQERIRSTGTADEDGTK